MAIYGGYIRDRRCPTSPEHGTVLDIKGGHYCPHHDHDHPVITKSFWTEAEFEAAKTAGPPEKKADPLAPVAIPAPKKRKRK